jgi:soluble lytic murein transglycosylase-like protein
MLYKPCTISWLAPKGELLRIVVALHKRLLGILTIGGVTVLSLVPSIARAEDVLAPHWQDGPAGRFITNVNVAEPLPLAVEGLGVAPAIRQSPERGSPQAALAPPDVTQGGFQTLIESIARNNGIDPALIDAMIRTESNYNPWAISSKGARGLMQLIPETGRRFGVLDFFDPRQNIEGGVRYIKYLLDMFEGNIDLSLAAYNAGENLVARLGRIPPYPETRNYVRKIRALYTKPSSYVASNYVASNLADTTAMPAPVVSTKLDAPVTPPSGDAFMAVPVSISKWRDDRGVRHFSNLEPAN